jgi:endonuclease G
MDTTEITFVLPLEVTLKLGQQSLKLTPTEGINFTGMVDSTGESISFDLITSSQTDYSDRSGYDKDFLITLIIELETILDKFISAKKLAPLLDTASGPFLKYTNFSTAQHRSRRMALLTAVNIQGKSLEGIKRTKDVWILDPRMDPKFQIGPAVYKANDLDRGHMVRRQDPVWGTDALLANEDTFHYTNSCPQHKDLNQKDWNVLEDYILDAAKAETLNVSVFTGPVFGESDKPYRDILLPLQFWKIAVLIKSDGSPSASGYILSQEAMLKNLDEEGLIGDTGFTTYQTYQVSLKHIAELTNLSLDTLYQYDPLNTMQAFKSTSFVAIKSSKNIKL